MDTNIEDNNLSDDHEVGKDLWAGRGLRISVSSMEIFRIVWRDQIMMRFSHDAE